MITNKKIIIVEDDKGVSLLMRMELESVGYLVQEFESPDSLIPYLKEQECDLIILDYRLKKCTAREVLNDFEVNSIKIPFIIMTGYGDQMLAVEMMKKGAVDYIIKDIALSQKICSIVDKAFSHIQTKRKLKDSQLKLIHSERRYRSIFENIQDIYFETDREGEILEISPSINKILGIQRFNFIGQSIFELVAKQISIERLKDAFSTGKQLDELELTLTSEEGQGILCSINCKHIDNKIIGTIRDISKRKKLEEQLMHAVINTEEKERTRFSQELHDGMGPVLASIKLYINLLARSKTEEEKNRANMKALELLDDAVSGIRTIANNLTPSILKDFGLVEAIESFCQNIAASNALEINVTYKENYRLDETKETVLYRVIQELVHNTLKHAGATAINIDLSFESSSLCINYSDNGVGMDLDDKMQHTKGGMGIRNIMSKLSSVKADFKIKTNLGNGFSAHISLPTKQEY